MLVNFIGAASNCLWGQSHSKVHFLPTFVFVIFMPTDEDDDLEGPSPLDPNVTLQYAFVYTHTWFIAHTFDYSTEYGEKLCPGLAFCLKRPPDFYLGEYCAVTLNISYSHPITMETGRGQVST